MELLWQAGADVLLIETQPSLAEARIELSIAEELGAEAWVSFSCRDGSHINEGDRIRDCAAELEKRYPQLRMIGVNCTPPQFAEHLIGELKDAFLKQHPDIEFDAYVAGAGKLMAKIAAERQSGAMVADVLWHSEVPDFYQLKKEGVLEAYKSPNAQYVDSPVIDPDGYFTPARNGTLGIVYNTRFIKEAPKTWQDVLGPDYKDAFGIADPALSGTAYGSVAALVNLYGWDYFKEIQKNGGVMSQGSGQVVDDTAMGDLVACIGGGSNAAGTFYHYADDGRVRLVLAEAGGAGAHTPQTAATLTAGTPGVLHGSRTLVLQDADGQVCEAYSLSAGLDYPGVGPMHADLVRRGRATVYAVTDDEALRAAFELTRLEGIIPALESAHALAVLSRLGAGPDDVVALTLSGRGDKDLDTYMHSSLMTDNEFTRKEKKADR